MIVSVGRNTLGNIELTQAVNKIVDRHFFGINNMKSYNKLTVGYIHKFEEDMYNPKSILIKQLERCMIKDNN